MAVYEGGLDPTIIFKIPIRKMHVGVGSNFRGNLYSQTTVKRLNHFVLKNTQ